MEISHQWFIVSTTPDLGPIKLAKLLYNFENFNEFFNKVRTDSKFLAQFKKNQQSHLLGSHIKELDIFQSWLDKPDHHFITIEDKRYPALLKQIPDPPLVLYAIGNIELLGMANIAIVGSRNPSYSGRKLAQDFAASLSDTGLGITSGLALGIDAEAHAGCLSVKGKTIAVLGHGLDTIYPAKHKNLAKAIIENGLLLSEYPPGVKPLRHHFPQRNRIISGISLGVLVVEAARQSGSLITARLAMEQGREVFAIPGSINNPLTKGGHALIKQGAKLVEDITDITEELGHLYNANLELNVTSDKSENISSVISEELEKLLHAMGFEPVNVDTLCSRTGLTPEVVCSMLLQLELTGRIEMSHGGFYLRQL